MSLITDCRKDFLELMKEMKQLRDQSMASTVHVPADNHKMTMEPVADTSVTCVNQGNGSANAKPESHQTNVEGEASRHRVTPRRAMSQESDSESVTSSYEVIDSISNSDSSSTYADVLASHNGAWTQVSPRHQRKPKSSQVKAASQVHDKQTPSRHGDQVLIARGHSGSLRAVPTKGTKQSHSFARTITGIFVSRLDQSTSAAQVAVFIQKETGLTVRPEKLATKYEAYSSFYIKGNKRTQDTLLDVNLWPRGTLMKPFYN